MSHTPTLSASPCGHAVGGAPGRSGRERHSHAAPPTTAPALALALVLLLGTAALPSAHAADAAAMAEARALLQRAAAGETSAIDAGAARWQALSDAEPTNPVLRAYAGTMTTMRATTSWWPLTKLRHAEDGLAAIDKALAQLDAAHEQAPPGSGVPAALEVRFTAANTFLALPSLFNRGERGAQLLAQVLQHTALATSPVAFQAAVWMRAAREAQARHQGAEARQWLARVAATDSPQAAAARAQLKGM